jgi:hypothetical protein
MPAILASAYGTVRRFERPGQQAVFAHRLRRHLRVDAAGAQKHEPRHAVLVRAVNHVGLDHQVVADEFGRIAVVGDDAAYLGCGEEHVLGLLGREEGIGRGGVRQIQFGMRAPDEVRVALRFEVSDDGRADQTAMACYIDARVKIQDARSGAEWVT